MPRPTTSERQFDDMHARYGLAGIVISSPMGLVMLAILMAGGSGGNVTPGHQAVAPESAAIVASVPAPAAAATDIRPAVVAVDISAVLADPAIREFKGLAENSWDFTDPNGVPGFGPMPSDCGGCRIVLSSLK